MGGITVGYGTDSLNYAIRITFGIVHGTILTLCCFALSFYLPFPLFGCIVAPFTSLALTIFCNICVEYVSESKVTMANALQTCWIPPVGLFCLSCILFPLEMMPKLLFPTFILTALILTTLLQIHAAKGIQASSSESVSSTASPT